MRRIMLCLTLLASLVGCQSRESYVAEFNTGCTQRRVQMLSDPKLTVEAAQRLAQLDCWGTADRAYDAHVAQRQQNIAEGIGFVAGAILGAAVIAAASPPVLYQPVAIVPVGRPYYGRRF